MLNWVKNNKLTSVLLVVVFFFLASRFSNSYLGMGRLQLAMPESSSVAPSMKNMAGDSFGSTGISLPYDPSPVERVANVPADQRLVIQNSNLSLLVEDVQAVGNQIINLAKERGGFMVESSYNRPEDSPFATVTVRVPTPRLDETLEHLRGLALKVTNENIRGDDITESYIDINSRLESLEKVKAKFEGILDSAVAVQDILTVQREIINTQTQIDNLRGQAEALKQNADFTKVTVYLSTDELSLPYTPDEKFRPGVIFKLAVRSMLSSLQNVGELLIWVAVYAVLWVPALIIFFLVRRYLVKKNK